jgi:hypothetical protein
MQKEPSVEKLINYDKQNISIQRYYLRIDAVRYQHEFGLRWRCWSRMV